MSGNLPLQKELDNLVEALFPDRDEKAEEVEQFKQTFFASKRNEYASSLSEIRERALIHYYQRFNSNSTGSKRGSTRARQRKISRWLDRVGASFLYVENSYDFHILSEEYRTSLTVHVNPTGKQFKYWFEFTTRPEEENVDN